MTVLYPPFALVLCSSGRQTSPCVGQRCFFPRLGTVLQQVPDIPRSMLCSAIPRTERE